MPFSLLKATLIKVTICLGLPRTALLLCKIINSSPLSRKGAPVSINYLITLPTLELDLTFTYRFVYSFSARLTSTSFSPSNTDFFGLEYSSSSQRNTSICYSFCVTIFKIFFKENAAICDEIARLEEKFLKAKEERR